MPRVPVKEPQKTLSEKAKETRERIAALSVFKPHSVGLGAELAREVEAVPTIFPYVDYRIGVGGWPISRITTVQGPSNKGKSTFTMGLERSFLEKGHAVWHGDLERTTPKAYLKLLLGESFDYPGFHIPESIGNYTDVKFKVRQWCEELANLREKGKVDKDTTGLVVIDSLANLLPDNILEEIRKATEADLKGGKKKDVGGDGLKGRAGQIQAMWNGAWMKELTSVLYDTRCAFVTVVRENIIPGEGFFAEDTIKPVGGKEMEFSPSLRIRVEAKPLEDGEGKNAVMVGERHTVQIIKTKVSGKEEEVPQAYFFTSNGKTSPEGFDRPRDALELALETGVIEARGAWYVATLRPSSQGVKSEEVKLGQGKNSALEKLREDEGLRLAVEASSMVKRTK